jgi:hypothetical protein
MRKREAKPEKIVVYLAGPMEAVPDGGTQWRDRITPKLIEYFGANIEIIDPCKSEATKLKGIVPDNADVNYVKNAMKGWKASGDYEKFDAAVKRIIEFDLEAVRRSDFIIFYIDFTVQMGGTISELTVTHERNKHAYFVKNGNVTTANSWILGMSRASGLFYPNFTQLFESVCEDYKEFKATKKELKELEKQIVKEETAKDEEKKEEEKK